MGQRNSDIEPVDHIRPVQLADAPELAELLTIMGYPCDMAEAERRLIELEHDDRQLLLVAERSGMVCALLGLDFGFQISIGGNTCRLTALSVDPEQQRSGVGRSLLREAETRA
ncbi:MAG TPA: GNAT family N-acetyltransferase, partial [Xanthomonadaceae bacterium]|nr:GNAT family N-acetyltransferase [Xanthomonadaceae bacterium]